MTIQELTARRPAGSSSSVVEPAGQIGPLKRTGAEGAPPLAPLAFRVGVVGHRPHRLKHADLKQLTETIGQILGLVRSEVLAMYDRHPDIFDKRAPRCMAVSPLAEGADRLFAVEALKCDYELCCVLPFSLEEFERDFAPDVALEPNSLTQFRELLAQSRRCLQLDGLRRDAGHAYRVAGEVVLNQSDLLLLVWDGEWHNMRGGTEDMLELAGELGIPVVWIDARAPHPWQILHPKAQLSPSAGGERLSPKRAEDTAELRAQMQAAIELPRAAGGRSSGHAAKTPSADDASQGLREYYAERQPTRSLAIIWKAFRDVVGDNRLPRITLGVAPFEEEVERSWTAQEGQLDERARRILPYYAWPDKLAVTYADRYRSAFLAAFFLSAVAVGLALAPLGLQLEPHHGPETACMVLEIGAIIVILGLVIVARRSQWHERWINYRLAAELARHLRFVAPLGGQRAFPQIPAHCSTYGQPGATWMAWYVRALERDLVMPSAVIDNRYLTAYLKDLLQLVNGQIGFHDATLHRSHRIEKRLHRIGITLLLLTLTACLLHLLPSLWHGLHLPDWLPPALTFCCGFFPALGAATAGILNQGEFRRIEKRSESMREQLLVVRESIVALQRSVEKAAEGQTQFSTRTVEIASSVTRLLVNEVLDWRVVFLDRPVVPPA